MQKKIVTFGEVMMRLSPPDQQQFIQARQFDALYAGSEANVAASLSLMGMPAVHVTCFPQNDLGVAATQELQRYGVDMRFTAYREGRMGLYFIDKGASVRSPKIIYDRFDSAFAHLDPRDFDWEKILADAQWLHWSGITPAVSQGAADALLQAVTIARKKGITVSGDINYRRNLWQYGKTAQQIMPPLIECCDVVVAGITDFENCLGIAADSYEETCKKVMSQYRAIRKVTTTIRETINASHNRLQGMLWDGNKLLTSKTYDLYPIIDRVGGGDAFMAGVIYGMIEYKNDQQALEFGVAASSLKHTVIGDVNTVTAQDVETLMRGENVGKLLR